MLHALEGFELGVTGVDAKAQSCAAAARAT